jgi:hypothetical protein
MSLIVRFHALNPTMKAREDLPVLDFAMFLTQAEAARHDEKVSGVSLLKVCRECENEETVGRLQTQLVRPAG